MFRYSSYLPFVAAMALVVVASNILVQFPVQGQLGSLALADILTWGAFTYPFAFLVTDLANRRYGPAVARRIVFVGFVVAVACSIIVPPLLYPLRPDRVRDGSRPAAAHRHRFRLGLPGRAAARRHRVQLAAAALLVARAGLRLAGRLGRRHADLLQHRLCRELSPLSGPNDGFALENAPLLGVLAVDTPRWLSWALGDLSVKLLIALVALIPYRLIAARWTQPALAS